MANKKQTKSKNTKKKKVLNTEYQLKKKDSLDKTIKDIRKDAKDTEFKKSKNTKEEFKEVNNIHEKIQSFISILFTIIIFILMLFLILVIYNNYLKPNKDIDKEKICEEYKKDYKIDKDKIIDYIKHKRSILYNLNNFDVNNLTNDNILTIAKFIIWSSTDEYIKCDNEEKCLTTKKEMNYDDLINEMNSFLNKDDVPFTIPIEQESDINLYLKDDKVVVTFSEFEFETLKHEIVDIVIDEDNITVYFALSKRIPNSDYYNYIGGKKMTLKYIDKKFILNKIETNISE